MKITAINVHNVLGVRAVEAKLTKPVTIFAGPNHSGKSSLQEAIRMALTGESVRVSLKKDYALLVNDTEKSGFAEIEVDGSAHAFITLPDGKTALASDYVMPPSLPYVLDAQRFASMDPDARRTFLYGLMGISIAGDEVKARLIAKHCDPALVEQIIPMMRSGFEAAHKEAQGRAREAKAAWKAVTGETYGEKKAETWRPAAPEVEYSEQADADLQAHAAHVDEELSAANQRLGMLNAEAKRFADAAGRIEDLKARAGRQQAIADRLNRDAIEFNNWIEKVEALKSLETPQFAMACPDCGAMLVIGDDELVHAKPQPKTADGDLSRLPEYEKARDLMQRAVANGNRDLADAAAAQNALDEITAISGTAPSADEIAKARTHLDELKTQRTEVNTKVSQLAAARVAAKTAAQMLEKAQNAHASVLAWTKIADALAPDGIPGEILAAALDPLNERLFESSTDADWLRPCVSPDMLIGAAYPMQSERPYALLSESEKWRVDAMLAEAISRLSGLGVLVLDRLDCLDLQGRSDLIAWLDGLVEDGEIQSAILFGTLKSLPTGLPDAFDAIWIDQGVVEQVKEAA